VVSDRSKETKVISFRVPVDVYNVLEFLARAQGISPNEFVKRVVLAWLKAKNYIK